MIHRWLYMSSLIGLFGIFALSTVTAGDKPKIGDTMFFAGDFAPAGWEYCSGKELQIAEHRELYDQIGTTHGGDGQENFYLPSLGKVEAQLSGVRVFIALEGESRQRTRADEAENKPFIGEITVHYGDAAPEGWAFCDGKVLTRADSPELINILGGRFGSNGALPDLREAETTMQGLRYIIALEGAVPQQ